MPQAFIKQAAILLLISMMLAPGFSRAADKASEIEIPYTKFVLKNGLTLLVHEDHKAPIVAVDVWYHVASKNERPGKTGFAHLFEHLMFNGSEHFNDDYFQAMERIGATNLNGTTSQDRTNYFENVPTSALDIALWMESDRMGHMIGVINQAKLDEQRGVVQNEKRQGENQPYSIAEELIHKACYPAGHPYSWTVIGSMDDLSSASLADVHQWFRTYYGAANATLTIAGDIDPQTARQKVEKFFGDIPSGPPVVRPGVWAAKRTGSQRQVAQDRVPAPRIYKVWNIPGWGTADGAALDMAASVLSSGRTSRLHKRLVYDDQIATNASASAELSEIGGLFVVTATARPGVEVARLEKAIDEEMARFLKDGPTIEEMERIRTQALSGFVRGVEKIGGFGGKADILAEGQVFGGNPEQYKTDLKRIREATPQQLLDTARQWLTDGVYILEIQPFPNFEVVKTAVDRTTLPLAGPPPEVKFPALERATLSNGLKVILAERTNLPLVHFNLVLDAGVATDQFARPGVAGLALAMLNDGTKTRTGLELSDELLLLGADIGTGTGLDVSGISMSTLKDKLDPALDLYADVILHPSYPAAEFDRRQKQTLAGIRRDKMQPQAMTGRVLGKLLYGADHPYAELITEAALAKITREDLVKFHETWFKPNNATMVVVGATTLPEITSKLEKLFKDWPAGEVPRKAIGEVKLAGKQAVYLMDKPDAQQSYILACQIAPPKTTPDEIAIETMNTLLGGAFTSRINMNLREDKHWSYGARSALRDNRGQRPFVVTAPVQSDKTKESMAEIKKELEAIQTGRPVSAPEFAKTQANRILSLPGSWETMGAIGGAITNMVTYGLPDDYYQTYSRKVRELQLDQVNKVARELIHPNNILWIVVGDRAKIEGPIRELGFGELHVIDADGNPVQ